MRGLAERAMRELAERAMRAKTGYERQSTGPRERGLEGYNETAVRHDGYG